MQRSIWNYTNCARICLFILIMNRFCTQKCILFTADSNLFCSSLPSSVWVIQFFSAVGSLKFSKKKTIEFGDLSMLSFMSLNLHCKPVINLASHHNIRLCGVLLIDYIFNWLKVLLTIFCLWYACRQRSRRSQTCDLYRSYLMRCIMRWNVANMNMLVVSSCGSHTVPQSTSYRPGSLHFILQRLAFVICTWDT